jgi:hypothetical protein
MTVAARLTDWPYVAHTVFDRAPDRRDRTAATGQTLGRQKHDYRPSLQPGWLHTRSGSRWSCRLALWCGVAAPLELTRAQSGPVQRDDAGDSHSQSYKDADEREQQASVEVAIQPLPRDQPEPNTDRQRDTELRRYGQRLRRRQPGPFQTPRRSTMIVHQMGSTVVRHTQRRTLQGGPEAVTSAQFHRFRRTRQRSPVPRP